MNGMNLLREMIKDYNFHSELYGDIYTVHGEHEDKYSLGVMGGLNKYITVLAKELDVTVGCKYQIGMLTGEKTLYLYIEGDENND